MSYDSKPNEHGFFDFPKPFNLEERTVSERDLSNMALKEEHGFSLSLEESLEEGWLSLDEDLRYSDTKVLG